MVECYIYENGQYLGDFDYDHCPQVGEIIDGMRILEYGCTQGDNVHDPENGTVVLIIEFVVE